MARENSGGLTLGIRKDFWKEVPRPTQELAALGKLDELGGEKGAGKDGRGWKPLGMLRAGGQEDSGRR